MNPENATSPANLAAQVMPGMDLPARLWRSTMKVLRVALTATLIMTVLLLALTVWTEPAYSPASGAGYWMGVTGGSLMGVPRPPEPEALQPILNQRDKHCVKGFAAMESRWVLKSKRLCCHEVSEG